MGCLLGCLGWLAGNCCSVFGLAAYYVIYQACHAPAPKE